MPVATQSGVPSSFTQGDAVVFTYSDPGHPPPDWSLKLAMFKEGQPFTLPAATANVDGSYTFTFAPADTAKLPPGRYTAGIIATLTIQGQSAQRLTLCPVNVFVRPDLTAGLAQTDAMQILSALKTGMASLAKGTISSFSGGGQSWTKKNLKELMEAIDRWQVIVDGELAALGLSTRGGAKTLVARF